MITISVFVIRVTLGNFERANGDTKANDIRGDMRRVRQDSNRVGVVAAGDLNANEDARGGQH